MVPVLGSTIAVFVIRQIASLLTVPTATRVAVPPMVRFKMVEIFPLLPGYTQVDPLDALHDQVTSVNVLGKISLTMAPLTASELRLVTVIV